MNQSRLLFISRITQAVFTILSYKLLSSTLSSNEIGYYYFIVAVFGFCGFLIISPLGVYSTRCLNEWKRKGEVSTKVINLLLAYVVLVIPILLLIFLAPEKFSFNGKTTIEIFFLLFFYFITTAIVNMILPMLNILYFYKDFVFFSVLNSFLVAVVPFLVVVIGKGGVFDWLWSIVFIQTVISLGVLRTISLKFPHKLTNELSEFFNKKTWSFAYPIIFTNLGIWFLGQSYRYIFKGNVSLDQIGRLALGINIAAAIMGIVESLVSQVLQPDLFKKIEEENAEDVWEEYFLKSNIFYVCTFLYVVFLSPFIVRILLASKYLDLYKIVIVVAFSEFFRIQCNVINLRQQVEKNMNPLILPGIIGGALAILGYVILISFSLEIKWVVLVIFIGYLMQFVFLSRLIANRRKLFIKLFILLKKERLLILFPSSLFFWHYSNSLLISVVIAAIFGFYYLYILKRNYEHTK